MPLVKRINNTYVESYEIRGFFVDLTELTITVRMTKYAISEKGIPIATEVTYRISDSTEYVTVDDEVQVSVVQRDSTGAMVLDSNGNPVMTTETVVQKVTTPLEVKAFSEIISSVTSGDTLYKEIQKALYASFVKYSLKQEGFSIE